MIEKDNIFELLGNSTTKYHSAIFSSYSFDPLYFNNLFLPNLKRRGITNVIVLLDSTTYDTMLEDYGSLGQFIEENEYSLIRQESLGKGVFHSKIALFFGFEEAMAYVGSGNLTYSGQTLNEEVWGAINIDCSDDRNFPFLKQIWNYIKGLIPETSELLGQQISWIYQYTPWLSRLDTIDNAICRTQSGDEFEFIFNSEGHSIFSQVKEKFEGLSISSIEVVSPFYDSQGWLLEKFKKTFHPGKLVCWINNSGTSPNNMSSLLYVKFYAWKHTDKLKEYLHAKIYQFHTSAGTFLLLGSANATHNAWGDQTHVYNDEAMILFHTSGNRDYLKELGIDEKFSGEVSPEPRVQTRQDTQTAKSVTLCRAEVIGEILNIVVSSKQTGASVVLLDRDSHQISQYKVSEKIQITEEEISRLCMVVITDGNKEISNRCLVLLEETLVKNDPNPRKSKLTSLLNSSIQWDDNIAKILTFVTFESSNESKTPVKLVRKKTKDDNLESNLDLSAYEDISLKGRASILAIDSIRIADFLTAALVRNKDNSALKAGEADENASVDDMNSGNVTGRQEEDVLKDQENEKTSKRSAICNFLHRYIVSESRNLETFEAKMWKNQDMKYPDYFVKVLKETPFDRSNGSLNDYSAALVASSLICNELIYGNMKEQDAKYYLINSVGKFLLLHGKGYDKSNDYTYTKKLRMHKDIAITTLLSFSQLRWSNQGFYSYYGELLLLNLMASFNDMEDLSDVLDNFRDILQNFKYPTFRESVDAVYELYGRYQEFKFVDSKENIELIEDDWQDAYIWKSSVGFVLISNMKRYGGDLTKWKYSVTPVGYVGEQDDFFIIEAGKKVVLLLAFV